MLMRTAFFSFPRFVTPGGTSSALRQLLCRSVSSAPLCCLWDQISSHGDVVDVHVFLLGVVCG